MGKWFGWVFNARYFWLLPYVGYLAELRQAIRDFRQYPGELSPMVADILFRAVDQYTRGLASRVVNHDQLTAAVRGVVDVFVDVVDGKGTQQAQEPIGGV